MARPQNPVETRAARCLRAWAEKRGLSQAGLAGLIGIDPGRLSRLLHGSSSPTLREVVALEQLAGVRAAWWLG